MPILLGFIGLAALFFTSKAGESEAVQPVKGKPKMLFDIKDIEASMQKGGYKTEFDVYFEAASDEFGVPFALLKAHALMESSLKEKAFRDENPSKREDRTGWASRGLMQLLWANDLNNPKAKNKLYDRFKKYGYGGVQLGNGDILFDPNINIRIAAQLIADNLKACGGNLRDAINMYNAGVKESVRKAPENYVDRVLTFYKKILGEAV